MTGTHQDSDRKGPGNGNSDHDPVATLMRQARPRPRPPQDVEEQVHAAVHAEWQKLTQGKRRNKATTYLAVAASVVVFVALIIQFAGPGSPGEANPPVGFSGKVVGHVTVENADDAASSDVTVGQSFEAGQVIVSSSNSGLAVMWQQAISIRLDEESRLRLVSAGVVELLQGRIYIDTGANKNATGQLRVKTPHGIFRHLGTQFMTRVMPTESIVSVREGSVSYQPVKGGSQPPGALEITPAGQRLTVTFNGETRQQAVPAWGGEWAWVESLATKFIADGRTIDQMLNWVESETGRTINYQTTAARQLAENTELHGQLDAEPLEALKIVALTSDLDIAVRNGEIEIDLKQPD